MKSNVLGKRRLATVSNSASNTGANLEAQNKAEAAGREKALKVAKAEARRLRGEVEKAAQLEAARAAEASKLDATRAAEASKLAAARAAEVAKMEVERAAEVKKLEAERAAEIKKLEADRAAEVKKLEAECAAEVKKREVKLKSATAKLEAVETDYKAMLREMEHEHEKAIDTAQARVHKLLVKLAEPTAQEAFPKYVPKARAGDDFDGLSDAAQRQARHRDIEYALWFVQQREWRAADWVT
eukprot:6211038-Pleurochrysis_carterae.AAC.1